MGKEEGNDCCMVYFDGLEDFKFLDLNIFKFKRWIVVDVNRS